MQIMNRASMLDLIALWDSLEKQPEFELLKGPETGMVMLRGRVGGSGNSFNLGEVTTTRAVVRLGCGSSGYGQVLGTDKAHAQLCAVLDAQLQCREQTCGCAHTANNQRKIQEHLAQIEQSLRQQDEKTSREVAATTVNFFTLARDSAS